MIELIVTKVKNSSLGVTVEMKHGDDEWIIKTDIQDDGKEMTGKTTITKNKEIVEEIDGIINDEIGYLRQKLFFEWMTNKALGGE